MTAAKKIMSNIVILYMATIFGHGLTLALIAAISRFLGAEGLGKYSFAIAFVSIFSIFSDFGVTTLMKKDLVKDSRNIEHYVGNILGFKFLINIIVVLLCFASIYFIDRTFEFRAIILIYAFSMFLEYLNWVFYSLYQIFQKIEYQSLIIALERFISVFGGIILLFLGYGLLSIFIIILISYLISFLISFLITNRKICKIRPNIDFEFCRKILIKSFPFWFSTIFLSVYLRIDTVILKLFTSYDVVGLYNAAYKLIDGLSFFPAVISIVIFPLMVGYHIREKEKLQLLFQTAIKYLFIIALPVAIGTTLMGDRIIYLFFGGAFSSSIPALQILIWAEILVFLNALCGQLLNAIDKEKAFAVSVGLGLLLNVGLNIVLIPHFSFIGSAVAVLITEIFLFALFYFHYNSKGYHLNTGNFVIIPLLAGAVMGAVVFLVKNLNLAFVIPIAAGIYFGILLFGKAFNREEISLIREMFNVPFLKNFK